MSKEFRLELSLQSQDFLKKTDKTLAIRILKKLKKLSKNPFTKDAKRVVNKREKVFRVRLGNYRIEYLVIFKEGVVLVTKIDKRSRSYR